MELFANGVLELVNVARDARARSSAAQTRYEIESAESRAVVDEAEKWFDILDAVTNYAEGEGHPLGDGLQRLFDDLQADSWSQGMDSMLDAIALLEEEGQGLTAYGLPADYFERSSDLAVRLRKELGETLAAESKRMNAVRTLRKTIDQIIVAFERISAARDLVMVLTGEELPGLELSLVRAAAAPRPTPVDADTVATGL